ncbi:MAG: septum formation initiator family protein [Chitinophagaceae bacterium]|nr:septum formation initiator family protein [Chitinophagaceae bacterium]
MKLPRIPSILRNKYLICFTAFCIIMLFLDKNDFFTQKARRDELSKNLQSKSHYTTENKILRAELEAIKTKPATMEKYAREENLMKKDGEEVFVIPEKSDKAKN